MRDGVTRHCRPAVTHLLLLSCFLVALTGSGALLASGFVRAGAQGTAHASQPLTAAGAAGIGKAAVQSGAPVAASGCGSAPPVRPGATGTLFLPSDGLRRTFRMHVPPSYTSRSRMPLVLTFHGTGSGAAAQERVTDFSPLADARHFLVAYPQGTRGPNGNTGWSSGGPGHPTVQDVRFVANLLTYVQARFCVDARRIYATGFSNGGGMTSLLACRVASRIAAFAAVSGSYYPYAGGCAPGRAVPILEVHGTADTIVPYNGRPSTHLMPVMTWLQAWAARDACTSGPQSQAISPEVVRVAWAGCRNGVSVVHYRILGGVHAWPNDTGCAAIRQPAPYGTACGGDRSLPATTLIWSFLAQYQLPATSPSFPQLAHAEQVALQPSRTIEADSTSGGAAKRMLAGRSGGLGSTGLREEPGQQRGVGVDSLAVPNAVVLSRVLRVAR